MGLGLGCIPKRYSHARLNHACKPGPLAAAARLTGPQRYLTYARLDEDLARDAAPWVSYGNPSSHELFSARMGCQVYGIYGLDLAALCIKKTTR